jgi:hypothetical protein
VRAGNGTITASPREDLERLVADSWNDLVRGARWADRPIHAGVVGPLRAGEYGVTVSATGHPPRSLEPIRVEGRPGDRTDRGRREPLGKESKEMRKRRILFVPGEPSPLSGQFEIVRRGRRTELERTALQGEPLPPDAEAAR